MADQSANLNIMIKAVRAGARNLMRDYLEVENLQASLKGVADFVGKGESAAEKIIKDTLKEGRPNYGVVSEWGGKVEGTDPTRYWIINPLDGKDNFIHALPHWAVSVALETKGQITAAAVYDPIKSELFTAEKGAGAWMNERRCRVSGRSLFSEMMFATNLPDTDKQEFEMGLKATARAIAEGAIIRRFGCATLDLAYTASGRFDGYFSKHLETWQIAAGELLVREAGGFATTYDGEEHPYHHGQVVAAGAEISAQLRSIAKG